MKYHRFNGTASLIKYCHVSEKPCYDKKTAVTAKNKRYKDSRVKLRVYPCPHCNAWHLTSDIRD